MIIALDIPDLWISEISKSYSKYTFTNNSDFVTNLLTNGSVLVGYYKLSALET
jgi:hypothetical protein